ncbi:MAG: helix-turn-helix domain-containing protein, partial [Anaerolineaceae bacterium]|nr:helix-turn-helix domain-containing protein [Anaerolineaceae bacterium]
SDAMREAANNPGGGAGLTAGIGAGLGIGNVLSQSLAGIGQNQPQVGSANVAAAAPIPSVMTTAEAANVLKVAEADVVAAITSGGLKAKKIGESYRISKEALENFLKE